MTIPGAGIYTAWGKVVASTSGEAATARCSLIANTTTGGAVDSDESAAELESYSPTPPNANLETLSLEVAHRFTGPGTIRLDCMSPTGTAIDFSAARIIAIRLCSLASPV